jgi:hypothetical protein
LKGVYPSDNLTSEAVLSLPLLTSSVVYRRCTSVSFKQTSSPPFEHLTDNHTARTVYYLLIQMLRPPHLLFEHFHPPLSFASFRLLQTNLFTPIRTPYGQPHCSNRLLPSHSNATTDSPAVRTLFSSTAIIRLLFEPLVRPLFRSNRPDGPSMRWLGSIGGNADHYCSNVSLLP